LCVTLGFGDLGQVLRLCLVTFSGFCFVFPLYREMNATRFLVAEAALKNLCNDVADPMKSQIIGCCWFFRVYPSKICANGRTFGLP
jgi:hypothetical protein